VLELDVTPSCGCVWCDLGFKPDKQDDGRLVHWPVPMSLLAPGEDPPICTKEK
jgi:hypothetical protein